MIRVFTSRDNKKTRLCIFSDGDHESKKCEKAKKMILEDRKNKVKEKDCCLGCLITGHNVNKCRLHLKCSWCDIIVKKESEKEQPNKSSQEMNFANFSINSSVSSNNTC